MTEAIVSTKPAVRVSVTVGAPMCPVEMDTVTVCGYGDTVTEAARAAALNIPDKFVRTMASGFMIKDPLVADVECLENEGKIFYTHPRALRHNTPAMSKEIGAGILLEERVAYIDKVGTRALRIKELATARKEAKQAQRRTIGQRLLEFIKWPLRKH